MECEQSYNKPLTTYLPNRYGLSEMLLLCIYSHKHDFSSRPYLKNVDFDNPLLAKNKNLFLYFLCISEPTVFMLYAYIYKLKTLHY